MAFERDLDRAAGLISDLDDTFNWTCRAGAGKLDESRRDGGFVEAEILDPRLEATGSKLELPSDLLDSAASLHKSSAVRPGRPQRARQRANRALAFLSRADVVIGRRKGDTKKAIQ